MDVDGVVVDENEIVAGGARPSNMLFLSPEPRYRDGETLHQRDGECIIVHTHSGGHD